MTLVGSHAPWPVPSWPADAVRAPAPTVTGTCSPGYVSAGLPGYRVDFSAFGGPADARIIGHQIVRLVDGDRPDLYRDCDLCDFDHPNSLWIDDGNYLVSLAVLSEVTWAATLKVRSLYEYRRPCAGPGNRGKPPAAPVR